ncbi:hypothetical protein [Sporolituus thermophilus]|uniref:Uncharacterized protein n=1 Tax=Sporolituus thermophilus DSM 23256 TaxID=1123285 RepID=A0A1G7JIQ7_9FIRM|nr:hypothetical protein [Sporolituus thermophilus]SDF24755.1 hypothetical protein SAMN05660235_00933 [Sporolituus thermophilus DSM 23256]
MQKAEEFAVAYVVFEDDEWFIVGRLADIQRLSDAGYVERAWDIKLDNGHRPYAVVKKRVNFDISEPPNDAPKNGLTQTIAAKTGLKFSDNLHFLEHTYLFRPSPAFWGELLIGFAGADGRLQDVNPTDYYAIYRGYILHNVNGAKFVRLDPDTLV